MTEPVKLDGGNIRLYCGNGLEVMAGMQEQCVEMVWTDPPYGHNNNNGDLIHRREAALGRGEHGEARAIANDGEEANEVFRQALPLMYRILRPGCCCCCCCGGGGGPDPQFARWSLWMDEVFNFKQMVVWDKGPMGMGWHYRRSYETVLVGEVPGAACHWYAGRRVENIIRPGAYGIRKIIPAEDQHPTEKPVELPAAFIQWHTQADEWVVDPFMGEGGTAIAAIRAGRRFVGAELSPEHFNKAVAKIEIELANRNGDGPLMRAAKLIPEAKP